MGSWILLLFLLPSLLLGEEKWSTTAQKDFFVTITFSKETLLVDDTLEIDINLQFPKSYTVDFDSIRAALLKSSALSGPAFQLLSEKTEEKEGEKKARFILEPLLAGNHALSLYEIRFYPIKDKSLPVVSIFSKIFDIKTILPEIKKKEEGVLYPILSPLQRFPIAMSSENRIEFFKNPKIQHLENEKNIKTVKQATFPWEEFLGVLLFLFFILLARMQPKRTATAQKDLKEKPITARRKALKSLDLLQTENLPQKRAFQKYYSVLSDTVKRYTEDRFQLKIAAKTTKEFLELISKNPAFDEKTKALLRDFFLSSDKVKFAEYRPTEEECKKVLLLVKQFVEN